MEDYLQTIVEFKAYQRHTKGHDKLIIYRPLWNLKSFIVNVGIPVFSIIYRPLWNLKGITETAALEDLVHYLQTIVEFKG